MSRSRGKGDGNSYPTGGRSSKSSCEGPRPPITGAIRLGIRGAILNWWSQLKERLLGLAAPVGAGTRARGTGRPFKPVFAAQGATARDGSPEGYGPAGSGDGKFCLAGGRNLGSAFGIRRTASSIGVGPWARRMGSRAQLCVAAEGAPTTDDNAQWRGPTGYGARRPAHQSSQIKKCMREMADPNGARPRVGGRGVLPSRW